MFVYIGFPKIRIW